MKMILIYTTFSSEEKAKTVCKKLIEERLIACANIYQNCLSQYIWNNKIVEEKEIPVIMKTNHKNLKNVKSRLLELHDYQISAIVLINAESLNPAYSKWLRICLTKKK
ncbi:MAG: divalent-cation tolerance protein CutA [Candidatus Anstonellales archaeon]